jgi:hypothetical protein
MNLSASAKAFEPFFASKAALFSRCLTGARLNHSLFPRGEHCDCRVTGATETRTRLFYFKEISMTKNKFVRTVVMCSVMAASSMMFAQGPAQNINPSRHANLASAQRSIAHAYQKIETAQQANRGRLGGHGERAKALLVQASQELKMAAEYANHRK